VTEVCPSISLHPTSHMISLRGLTEPGPNWQLLAFLDPRMTCLCLLCAGCAGTFTTIVRLIPNLAVKLNATGTRARLNNRLAEPIATRYLSSARRNHIPLSTIAMLDFVLQTGGDVPSKSHGHQTMYKPCSQSNTLIFYSRDGRAVTASHCRRTV